MMIRMKSFFILILFFLSPFLHAENLTPYFKYDKEAIASLKKLSSSNTITIDELKQWDDTMFDIVRRSKMDVDSARIYTYVYTAQRDAAALSKEAKDNLMGSIGPISKMVLCQFLQTYCDDIIVTKTDDYSNKLADIVITKIKLRIEEDKRMEKKYIGKVGSQYWKGVEPYFGQTFGSWKTWFLKSSNQFRAPTPPTEAEWQKQLLLVKEAHRKITDSQKRSVVFWAGGPGTISPPGIWLTAANNYMWDHHVPLEKALLVRSVLAMGLEDSIIAVFDSKYTYMQRRPFMRDSTIQTVMPTPNHPTYPAAHSAISGAASTILNYYFPDAKKEWNDSADEASQSRVWGGIHYPIDNAVGMQLGKKVGEYVIQSQLN